MLAKYDAGGKIEVALMSAVLEIPRTTTAPSSFLRRILAFLGYRLKVVPDAVRPWQLALLAAAVVGVTLAIKTALAPFGPEATHKVSLWLDVVRFINAGYLCLVAKYPKRALPSLYLIEAQPAVVASGYHLFLGVPNAYWGVLTYGSMAGITALVCPVVAYHGYAVTALMALSSIGFIFSARLMRAMFLSIRHVCPFCVFSAGTMSVVFLLTLAHVIGR